MNNILTTDFENTRRVFEEFGEKVKEQYQQNLEANRHTATGNLHDNIEVVIIDEPDRLEIALNLEDYWKWIENGRNKGGFPPVDAIKKWIEVKQIVPRPGKNGKVPTIDQLSFLIGRKIRDFGYPPVGHPFDNAVQSVFQDFEDALNEALMTDLGISVDKAMEYLEV